MYITNRLYNMQRYATVGDVNLKYGKPVEFQDIGYWVSDPNYPTYNKPKWKIWISWNNTGKFKFTGLDLHVYTPFFIFKKSSVIQLSFLLPQIVKHSNTKTIQSYWKSFMFAGLKGQTYTPSGNLTNNTCEIYKGQ